MDLLGLLVLASLLLAGCGSARSENLFYDADLTFEVQPSDYQNCQTGDPITGTPSPEHALTRVGLRWHEDGEQLDFLLEFGGVNEYRSRTFAGVNFIDATRPFTSSNDGSDHAHNRMHFGISMHWGDRDTFHDHFWYVKEDGEWRKDPSAIRTGNEVEIRGNQARLTVPITFLEVTGPNDPRIADLSWHVTTGSDDDATDHDCISSGLEAPWPLELEVLALLESQ